MTGNRRAMLIALPSGTAEPVRDIRNAAGTDWSRATGRAWEHVTGSYTFPPRAANAVRAEAQRHGGDYPLRQKRVSNDGIESQSATGVARSLRTRHLTRVSV